MSDAWTPPTPSHETVEHTGAHTIGRPYQQIGSYMVSLLAVTLGAVIALTATVLGENLRGRRERAAVLSRLRYDSYLNFALAFVRANDALRDINTDDCDRRADVAVAIRDSDVYL